MAAITRTYTFSDGTTAFGSQVDSEVANIVSTWNNHDAGTSKWTVLSALNASTVPLIVDNGAGSNDVANFKVNGTTAVAINSSGQIDAKSHKLITLSNGTAATDAAAFGQIKVLQAVFASTTTAFTTTSNTFQTTNLSATITPTSASNRILVIASSTLEGFASNVSFFASISRAGSNLLAANGQAELFVNSTLTSFIAPATLMYVDSPATTSASIYAVLVRNSDNATTLSWGRLGTQTLLLLEIV